MIQSAPKPDDILTINIVEIIHLLDNWKKSPKKLNKNVIAIFQLKADVVRFDPS